MAVVERTLQGLTAYLSVTSGGWGRGVLASAHGGALWAARLVVGVGGRLVVLALKGVNWPGVIAALAIEGLWQGHSEVPEQDVLSWSGSKLTRDRGCLIGVGLLAGIGQGPQW